MNPLCGQLIQVLGGACRGQPIGAHYFWRDNSGLEADLLFERDGRLQMVEIKSGQTVTTDYVRAAQKTTRSAICCGAC